MDFKGRRIIADLELLYRVTGRGTQLLSRSRPGDELSVLGPLGKGFTLPDGIRRVIFIAGGVGVAPLTFLLHRDFCRSGAEPEIRKNFLPRCEERGTSGRSGPPEGFCELRICTDDGSLGYHGLVTALFKARVLKHDIGGYDPEETMLYACGPTAMIRSLGRLLKEIPSAARSPSKSGWPAVSVPVWDVRWRSAAKREKGNIGGSARTVRSSICGRSSLASPAARRGQGNG